MRTSILGSVISSRLPRTNLRRRPRFVQEWGLYIGLFMVAIFVLAGVVGPLILRDPSATSSYFLSPPGAHGYMLGTDQFGRSQLARILWGTRNTIVIIVVSMAVSSILGTAVGLLSARFKWFDTIGMRVMDILMAFPAILLAIGIMAMVGPGVSGVIEAIAIVYIPIFARVSRGPAIEQMSREYVEAAKISGVSTARILVRHVLPNIWYVIIVQLSLAISDAILIEAALSYLGLGVLPPASSLGALLQSGQTLMYNAPWTLAYPALTIIWAIFGFNLTGDGLRDALNVRQR